MGDGGVELELFDVILCREPDFRSLDDLRVSCIDDTLLSRGLGDLGSDEGYRDGIDGRLLRIFAGRGGVRGATGGG